VFNLKLHVSAADSKLGSVADDATRRRCSPHPEVTAGPEPACGMRCTVLRCIIYPISSCIYSRPYIHIFVYLYIYYDVNRSINLSHSLSGI
jgi:hypothetical protein